MESSPVVVPRPGGLPARGATTWQWWYRGVKGSIVRITPPGDTRGSGRRARPSARPASGSSPDLLRCSVSGGHGQAQSPMWPLLEVMRDVGLEHPLEVSRTVDQDVVEALTAHGPHEPLREGIRPGGPDRGSGDPDALGVQHRIERSAALGVPVAQEEPNTREPLADGEVPRLLR